MYTKICGITELDDLRAVQDAGASAVGLNLVPSSKRRVTWERAAELVAAAGDLETVAIVADLSIDDLERAFVATGVKRVQLHGGESPEYLERAIERLGPVAYKAVGVATARDVERAAAFAGDRILVDAKVAGELGGTGQRFDWSLVTELGSSRCLLLAGGLSDANVAEAVTAVRPWGVDVASGVELPDRPGRKDGARVRRFVERARGA